MRRLIAMLLSGLLVAGCRLPAAGPFASTSPVGGHAGVAAPDEAPAVLEGRVWFAARRAQATIEDVAVAATVSLINTATSLTISTGLTDEQGRFRITMPKEFRADATATYYLEACKGLNNNQPGSAMARVRTVVKYANGGWVSLSSAAPNAPIVVSPATTAIALGAALRNGTDDDVEIGDLIGKLSESGFTPVPNLSAADFNALVGIVSQVLADEKDPVRFTGLDTTSGTWKPLERYAPLLEVTGVSPTTGVVGSTATFTGTSFSITPSNNVVRFNGTPAAADQSTGTTLSVRVPQGASSGETTVQVGNIITMGPIFTVPVLVDSFAPASAAPGSSITLTGSGFDMAVLSNNAVRFAGNAMGTVTAATDTTLTVTVPSGAVSGPLGVSVSGTSTAPASPLVVPVSVTGFTPPVVKPSGTFTVTGKGFGSVAASVSASVAGQACQVLAASPVSLTLRAPGSEMVGALSVTVEGQTGTSATNLRVFVGLAADATIQTVAGGAKLPPAGIEGTAWGLESVKGMVHDPLGNAYFCSGNAVFKLSSTNQLSVVAGTNVYGYSGDGGLATAAQLNDPWGLALDSAGNLYIADTSNHRIRKVDAAGIITTVAGCGTSGFSGDGDAASAAKLDAPSDVAVDAAGNLYIADTYNYCVRKVDAGGLISTVAGHGDSYGFPNDGVPAVDGYLGNNVRGVEVDAAGNLYIADARYDRIMKVDAGGMMTAYAGTGTTGYTGDGGAATSATLNTPYGLNMDAAGNLYIAEYGNHCVRKVTPGGTISTVAGTGAYGFSGDGAQASESKLNSPNAVSVDPTGKLFIADYSNYRLRQVDASGVISTIAGNGLYSYGGDGYQATSAKMGGPSDVAFDAAGNMYVTELSNYCVRKVTPGGLISRVVGTGVAGYAGDGGPANMAQLSGASSLAFDAAGNLYISDSNNHRIRKVDASGTISTVVGTGTFGYGGDGGPAVDAQVAYPRGLTFDKAGNLYFADTNNHRIRKVDTSGNISTVAGTGVAGGTGDGFQATSAQLRNPMDVAFDSAGNLYIVDANNHWIRKVDGSGVISTFAGSSMGISGDGGPAIEAQLRAPRSLAIDVADNVYILDGGNRRVRMVDRLGVITTVVGGGAGGDGGLATAAQLLIAIPATQPAGLAIDPTGRVLYVAETQGPRIRKIQ
ncbi:MAG TPA: IPT/TIG domain-containing protein [Pantanalinema sp.]